MDQISTKQKGKPDPHVAKANAYIEGVLSGTIPACKFVKQACQRQKNDLERFKDNPLYEWRPDRAGRVCRFIECLPHIKGPKANAGEKFNLQPWQCFIYTTAFGWFRKDTGGRKFGRVYIEVPKGNGKSPMSSGVALYGLTSEGEQGAEVYSAATTRGQARIVFGDAQKMMRKAPKFRDKLGLVVNKLAIEQPHTNSKFEPISRDADASDGQNISVAVIDEFHAHKTRDIYDIVEAGCAKRPSSLLWIITTAGKSTQGICYEVRGDCLKVLDGTVEDEGQFAIVFSVDLEPYEDTFQGVAALSELEKVCSCGCVPFTRIKSLWAEVCADLATRHGIGSTGDGETQNAGISIDPTAPVRCVASALINGPPSLTLTESGDSQKNRLTGPLSIPSAAAQRASVGSESPAIGSRCDSASTDSPKRNTSASSASRVANAASAERQSLYVSITNTTHASSADCSAENVIPQSACSEILNRVYNAHSITCGARKAKLSDCSLVFERPGDDPYVLETWIKANPNWGISVQPDRFASKAMKAQRLASARNNFFTKGLNIWCNADLAWMPMDAWDACADTTLVETDFLGEPCMIGLDLGSVSDLTAKAKVFWRDKPKTEGSDETVRHYYVFVTNYLPQGSVDDGRNSQYEGWADDGLIKATDGDVTDFAAVESDILSDRDDYRLELVAYDPWQGEYLVQNLAAENIKVVKVRPTKENLSAPMKEVEKLVRQRRLHHDGNACLRWQTGNVVSKEDDQGNVFPRKEKYENKIDAPVAIITVFNQAMTPEPSDGGSYLADEPLISF